MGRGQEAIDGYEEVLSRFGDAKEVSLREQVAKALVNKGITLGQLGRGQEAIDCYAEVLSRFGDAKEVSLREQVAKALVYKGFRLGQLGRGQEAIDCYAEVLSRFGDAKEVSLREQVAKRWSTRASGSVSWDVARRPSTATRKSSAASATPRKSPCVSRWQRRSMASVLICC